jgi:phosphatidylserine/phosphatidylglycerophosphate/cardiolipin synthase-like enzyme
MGNNGRGLLEQGQLLGVPPRTAEERQAFGRWLAAALAHCGLESGTVAEETGVPTEDIEAMVYDQSHGTAKAERCRVHDYVLEQLLEAKRSPESSVRGSSASPPPRLNDLLAGRIAEAAFFSPTDDLRRTITTVLESARAEIRIQTWQLSCPAILGVLSSTTVPIHIAISHTANINRPLHQLMRMPNVAVYCDPQRKNHNKTIVVDRRILTTGSVNFNYGSGGHDENLLVTSRPELVAAYWNDFDGKRARLTRRSA